MQELLHLFVLIMGTGASLRVSGECAEGEDAEGCSFTTLGTLYHHVLLHLQHV